MKLVDTNILAYLLIEGDRNAEAVRLQKFDPIWHSEEFILTEFSNVLASCIRSHALTMNKAQNTLQQAQALIGDNLHRMDHRNVLQIAHQFGVSAYDARYLALAQELAIPLVTEDSRLRRAAPKLTQSLEEALSDFA
ncbi:MAG TPA: type II toxin-antitoxin system VapC family toxin [Candidatus Kapabacteria bacterium]|nr:type II toxin-antitoxin system VapC family toxin [Candidatus Kapabacteria bacterium]